MPKPTPYPIKADVYKENGKWYAEIKATVDVYSFDDQFLPQLINGQNELVKDWYKDFDGFVVVDNVDPEGEDPFAKGLHTMHAVRLAMLLAENQD